MTDEAQYIDYPDYARLVQMVFDAALFVANADHAPRLDGPNRPTARALPSVCSARRARDVRRAPELAPDDQLLAAALERAGIRATPAVWSDRSVDWRSSDAVVIRSCWDYHRRHGEFVAWLDALDASRRPVWNPTPMVRWNSDERYLIDLAARGVATVPTRSSSEGRRRVPDVARAEGWTRFVVNRRCPPAHETHALDLPLGADDWALIERVVAHGDALVQPFVDEVTTDGELSLIFFDGEFSHAAIKRSGRGDFRVQTEHGGTVAPIDVVPAIIAEARRSLDALDEMPLYARVDGVGDERSFRLMELELIEPTVLGPLRFGGSTRGGDRGSARLVLLCCARGGPSESPCPPSPDATGRNMLLPPRQAVASRSTARSRFAFVIRS